MKRRPQLVYAVGLAGLLVSAPVSFTDSLFARDNVFAVFKVANVAANLAEAAAVQAMTAAVALTRVALADAQASLDARALADEDPMNTALAAAAADLKATAESSHRAADKAAKKAEAAAKAAEAAERLALDSLDAAANKTPVDAETRAAFDQLLLRWALVSHREYPLFAPDTQICHVTPTVTTIDSGGRRT